MVTKSVLFSTYNATGATAAVVTTKAVALLLILVPILSLVTFTSAQDLSSSIITTSSLSKFTTMTSRRSSTSTSSTSSISTPTRIHFPPPWPTPTWYSGGGWGGDGSDSGDDGDGNGSTALLPNGGNADLPPDPETRSEATKNQLLNLYFLLLGIGVILFFIGLHIYRKKKSKKRTRSLERAQNALRRDLELGGWRLGVNGFGRWGAGPNAARNSAPNTEEGLDERGEAPPPYSLKRGEEDAGTIELSPITIPEVAAVRHVPSRSTGHLGGPFGNEVGNDVVLGNRAPRLPSYEDVTSLDTVSEGNGNVNGVEAGAERQPSTLASPSLLQRNSSHENEGSNHIR